MFSGWVWDELKPYAERLELAHPQQLEAITKAKKKSDRPGEPQETEPPLEVPAACLIDASHENRRPLYEKIGWPPSA